MSFSTANSPTPDEVALWKVAGSTNDFSKQFFKALVDGNKGNLITSPLSAAVVLAMASYGAEGNTKIQMKNALHLSQDNDAAKSGFRSLMDKFNNVQNVELRLANRIFVNTNFPVKEEYQNLTRDIFRSAMEQVPFAQPAVAANAINTFCQKQTNNRIQSIVSEIDLDAATMMVLINAVYFKGTWLEKFDPEFTRDMPFHVDDKHEINVPTMYKKASFKYGVVPALKASFIELPYKGEEFSMVIILPDEINGLNEMLPKLTEVDIGTMLQSGRKQDVKVYLPKFRVESSMDLGNPLMKIGMQDLFTSKANFSGISDVPLMVSKVVQKAFIEVNEEGSEAAAVTAAQFIRISIPAPPIPIVQMKIDRPYHFMIIHVPSNTIFFGGIVTSPKFANGS